MNKWQKAADIATWLLQHDRMSHADYRAIRDGLDEFWTLVERDTALEKLWEEFGDVPMNPETECMEAPFLDFPAGTFREDIWRWFDERHSKGVAYLMYGGTEPSLDNMALWKALEEHWGHNVRIVKYGDLDDPADICLECDDCGLVILDAELYTLQARDDKEG